MLEQRIRVYSPSLDEIGLRQTSEIIGGMIALLGDSVLVALMTGLPATERLDPIRIHNSLIFAERTLELGRWKHGYPQAYCTFTIHSHAAIRIRASDVVSRMNFWKLCEYRCETDFQYP